MPSRSTEKERLTKLLLENDPLWHVQLTILVAIILQISLPDIYSAGPRFALPILEGLLLIVLSVTTSRLLFVRHLIRRINVLAVLVFIALGNVYALQRVSHELLVGGKITNGHQLVLSAINIYLTNIIVFGLVYWIIDGGGPIKRRADKLRQRDFLFIQMTNPDFAPPGWIPTFVDYLSLAGNTATAFSPTDTMPLSRRAKLLMLGQSLISLTIIGLVAARAVNILS